MVRDARRGGRLEELASEFGMVERALGDPAALSDGREYARLTRRHRELLPLVTLHRERETVLGDLEGGLAQPFGHAIEAAPQQTRDVTEQETKRIGHAADIVSMLI